MDRLALQKIFPSEIYYFDCKSDIHSLDDLRKLLYKSELPYYVHVQATSKYIIVKLYEK